MKAPSWNHLLSIAGEEVETAIHSLPEELRERAAQLPVTFEPRPNEEMVEDGIAPDTLGLFVGEAYPDSALSVQPLPPQILLFLENLWDFSDGDEEIYRDEIHTTLLHELGHYLGLDEDDLEQRGLD